MSDSTIRVPLPELIRLVEQWEPEASQSPPTFRQATCVKCAEPMIECWHLWINYQNSRGYKFIKEVHLCESCGNDYKCS